MFILTKDWKLLHKFGVPPLQSFFPIFPTFRFRYAQTKETNPFPTRK